MTRQLLEDIRHELIANLSEEKVRVFGLAVDVVKSYSDDDAKEYTFDVKYKGKDITVQDVFEAVGQHAAGNLSDEELEELENVACPGAGACGAQYTANTMATAIEFLGISPMGSASPGATDPRKNSIGFDSGKLVMEVLKRGQRPKDILTRNAFENAIMCATSTLSLIHI